MPEIPPTRVSVYLPSHTGPFHFHLLLRCQQSEFTHPPTQAGGLNSRPLEGGVWALTCPHLGLRYWSSGTIGGPFMLFLFSDHNVGLSLILVLILFLILFLILLSYDAYRMWYGVRPLDPWLFRFLLYGVHHTFHVSLFFRLTVPGDWNIAHTPPHPIPQKSV